MCGPPGTPLGTEAVLREHRRPGNRSGEPGGQEFSQWLHKSRSVPAGVNTSTYTSGSPTVAGMYSKLADVI
jgi:hypothetical protein